jgi:hypothetical protein
MRRTPEFALFVLFYAGVLSVAPAVAQTHNFWTSGASIPTAVVFPGGVGVLSRQIYVVGGDNSSNTAIADTQIYNPTTNTWSAGVSLPTAVGDGAGAVVNGKLYIIGGTPDEGITVTNAVWAFNLTTKTWSSKAPMPTARASLGAVVENKIIYAIGGCNGSNCTNRLNTVESYNPATDTWTEEAPLLVGRSEPSTGLLGNKTIGFTIVAADGDSPSGDTGDTEGYNANTNTWSSLKSDPTTRNAACTGAKGTKMFVAGGFNGNPQDPALSVNERFTLTTNSWKTPLAPMPTASMAPGSVMYKGLLYCLGGWTAFQGTVLNNLQIYHP